MGGIRLDGGNVGGGGSFASELADALRQVSQGRSSRRTLSRLKQQSQLQMFSEMQRSTQAATLMQAADSIDNYTPSGNAATDIAYLQGATAQALRTAAGGLGGVFGTSSSNVFMPLMFSNMMGGDDDDSLF